MMDSVKAVFTQSINELKRSQTDSSKEQIREIKKMKLEEPKQRYNVEICLGLTQL